MRNQAADNSTWLTVALLVLGVACCTTRSFDGCRVIATAPHEALISALKGSIVALVTVFHHMHAAGI
jgi:hypothetical protein